MIIQGEILRCAQNDKKRNDPQPAGCLAIRGTTRMVRCLAALGMT